MQDLSDVTAIYATYQLTCSADEVEGLGKEIAFEQTVEVSPHLVASQTILEEVVGRVENVEPHPNRSSFLVTIRYQPHLAGKQIPQLLNLIYGNVSMKARTRLVDLRLPEDFLNAFPGPRFGIEGLRNLLGVQERPLLATALKPRGSSNAELASLAHEFALGGGDLVKDDHNLIDDDLAQFEQRVLQCSQAVQKASEKTGRPCLYLPNLILPTEQLEPAIEYLLNHGIQGALVSPFVIGLDTVRALAKKYPLFLMGHPTFSGALFHDGTHGIDPGLILGTLFRLIGVDASIFPNAGGRFSFSAEECMEITLRSREPLGAIKPAFPTPAGGMRLDNIPEMADQFGSDAIYLIGSALLSHSGDLVQSTRIYLDRIEEYFASRIVPPATPAASSCELPKTARLPVVGNQVQYLPFQSSYQWEGREPAQYKKSAEIPFQDVTRHELIGQRGEKAAFDLRYFEIAPEGFSSLEKHVHTHTIIGVRGTGTLLCGEKQFPIRPMDVAYIPPLQVHQLQNASSEPFGFFCIVDHDRDRPVPA
ncbi:MAG: RuBisCO large subunit C-terminal-like domain-containing protein [Planctomycetales bacterium]